MTQNAIIAEVFYGLIGVIFIIAGIKALRDSASKKRITTAIFWFIPAFTFIVGPFIPRWITGACIVALGVLSAAKRVVQSKSDIPEPAKTREEANKYGYKVFIPTLCLALSAVLAATLLPFGANNAIGISAVVSLAAVFLLTRAPVKLSSTDGGRMMDSIGASGILPQILAALGSLFTIAGVGKVISSGVVFLIPEGSRFIACAVYCIGMAVFAFIMGNSFAAFCVITAGVGLPFLIVQGANPAVVGALGLTAGYCGTLCTPMAANFNIMPAALLETRDRYAVIKAQFPVASVMLGIHIVLLYFLAF